MEGSRTRRNTEGNRPSEAGVEENGRREMNLPYFMREGLSRARSDSQLKREVPKGTSLWPFTASEGQKRSVVREHHRGKGSRKLEHASSYDGKQE
ncbi:hypothetical protein Tco_0085360 [Tanacetum coccineum]